MCQRRISDLVDLKSDSNAHSFAIKKKKKNGQSEHDEILETHESLISLESPADVRPEEAQHGRLTGDAAQTRIVSGHQHFVPGAQGVRPV